MALALRPFSDQLRFEPFCCRDRTDELDDEADNAAAGHVEGRNTVRLLQVKQQRPEVAEEAVAMD
jgi:hypothetical protein